MTFLQYVVLINHAPAERNYDLHACHSIQTMRNMHSHLIKHQRYILLYPHSKRSTKHGLPGSLVKSTASLSLLWKPAYRRLESIMTEPLTRMRTPLQCVA